MTKQVTKTFEIVGNGEMHGIGARPRIYALANNYGVMVLTTNVDGNKIEVIAKGRLDNIKRFRESVKTADLNPSADSENKKTFEVKGLKKYNGDNEPEFEYFASSLTLEQISKGIEHLHGLEKLDKLDTLPKDIADELAKVLREEED